MDRDPALGGEASTPERRAESPKAGRQPTEEAAKPRKEGPADKKAAAKPGGERTNKKAEVMMRRSRGVTLTEILEHRLAEAQGSRLRLDPRIEGRGEDRIGEECCRPAHLQNREAACPFVLQNNAASGISRGGVPARIQHHSLMWITSA